MPRQRSSILIPMNGTSALARPRVRTHYVIARKMMVAAMQMADMKVWAHRS